MLTSGLLAHVFGHLSMLWLLGGQMRGVLSMLTGRVPGRAADTPDEVSPIL